MFAFRSIIDNIGVRVAMDDFVRDVVLRLQRA